MATEPNLREFAEQLRVVFREYAKQNGWSDDAYRVFLNTNEEWNTAHVILVSEKLKDGAAIDQWKKIMTFLDDRLHRILVSFSTINLSLRTLSQMHEGGIYEFGSEFVPIEDILVARPVA